MPVAGEVPQVIPSLLEEDSVPSFRTVMGMLMSGARRCDFAVQHVRLADIDFSAAELASVRCRLLLGRFDAGLLADLREDDTVYRQSTVLAEFLDSGRLAVRAAGLLRWYPDFSVHYRGRGQAVGMLGTHNPGRVTAPSMPLLTGVVTGPDVLRLARHFRALWRRGHDVRDVIRRELRDRGR
jgi:hypothetical protein